jgi:hypothetical protein
VYRASSTSVVIARSSASRTESLSRSSSNARTHVASHGPFFSADSTRRVSPRYKCEIPQLFHEGYIIRISQRQLTFHLQEVAKKRSRRTVKSQRAIVGASLDVIKERRSQRPEARAAARQAAIASGKEKRASTQAAKKAEKAKAAGAASKGQTSRIASKQGAKGAPVKVAAKSR